MFTGRIRLCKSTTKPTVYIKTDTGDGYFMVSVSFNNTNCAVIDARYLPELVSMVFCFVSTFVAFKLLRKMVV